MKLPWQWWKEYREEVSKNQIIHELRIIVRDLKIDLAERDSRIERLEAQLAYKPGLKAVT